MAVAISYRERYPFGTDAYDSADEHWHQVCVCEFVRKEYPAIYKRLFAIPNGGHRNRVEAANLKMEGLKPGVTDLELANPVFVPAQGFNAVERLYCGLFLEMKKPQRSYGTSEAQEAFMQEMRGAGYATAVAYGWYQAVGIILYYLGEISLSEAQRRFEVNMTLETFGEGWKR